MNIGRMTRNLIWMASLVLCMGVTHAQQQGVPVDTLVKLFSEYRENSLQEKIYAHIDRTFYLTGETLWFKIYAVDGIFHKPLDLSKVAYAEILDKANLPVLQAKISMHDGRGDGYFFLPASLMSGNYRLRIYTSWMKNFSPEFYYDEKFTLVNPFVTSSDAINKADPGYSIDFFPEGGYLVSGIRSKIAFHILNPHGRGANLRGWVLNSKNDTVVSFAGEKFGIGSFLLTPSAEEHYRVMLDHPAVKGKTFSVPGVHPAGYVMQVTDSSQFVRVLINVAGVAAQNIYLFAHARQSILRAEVKFLGGKGIFEIEKNQMPEGITHFTLFNSHLQPLCERLYFTFPNKRLDIGLSTDQENYLQRKKVSVSLRSTKAGAELPAKMSMSVYKIDSLSLREGTHVYPYLWLSSDLTGRLESPEYYFTNPTDQVRAAMDNLMLTHGWRRFDWKDILSGETSHEFLPEIREHIATVTVKQEGRERRGILTYLASPGKRVRAYGAWSDDNGEVKFPLKDFYGPNYSSDTHGLNRESYDKHA